MLIILFLLIQIRNVQVYVAKRAANYLSERLHTRVYIGSVDIQFFKKLVLEDVYIEDLHHDTLLYSKKIKLRIRNIDLKNHKIDIAGIELLNTKTKLIQYIAEDDFNFQFIINSFASDTSKIESNTPWNIKFDELTLINNDFTYRNEHDTLITTGVNYFDLRTSSVNAKIKNIIFDQDTIHANINYLSALEKSGFILEKFRGIATISPLGIQVDNLNIRTPYSLISTDLTFNYSRYRDFKDFNELVSMKAEFDHSLVSMKDIAYFAPALKGLSQRLIVSGKVSGKVNDLRGKKMDILLSGTGTQFIGDVKLKGLPNIEETAIYLNVESLKTNYKDLKQIPIPPFETNKKLDIPISIAKLGNMKFKGTFAGLFNDFYAYGNFSSALGNLSSDLLVSHDDIKNKENYKGKLKSTSFDLGKFLGTDVLGKVTSDVTIDGSGLTLEKIAANLKGTVTSLEFKNYTYKNILIEGDIAKQIFKGKLNVKDDNIDFDFNGNVDFTKELPHLNFISTINKANLGALHFITSAEKINLSTQLSVNVIGNNIDNLIGKITFDNTVYQQGNEVLRLNVLNLLAGLENGQRSIKLSSDFVDARVDGSFKILELPISVEMLLSNYLPSYFDIQTFPKNIQPQKFEFDFLFKKTDDLTRLFAPKITIAPNTLIQGGFESAKNEMILTGNSTKLTFGNLVFKNWDINAGSNENKLKFKTGCERLYLTDSTWLSDFQLNTTTSSDSVNLDLVWDNKTKKKSIGDIKAFLHFQPDNIIFKILPSQFYIADSVWNISKANEVIIDSNRISVNNLFFEHDNQSIGINGIISENKDDQIKLTLNNFNLANLNNYTIPLGLNFKGKVNGESTISDMYHEPLFLSNNNFSSLFVNDNKIGDGSVESIWNSKKEALYMHGSFTLGIVPNILFSGYYYPKKTEDNLDMALNVQALQMQIFVPFVKDYCSDFSGLIAGNMTILGTLKEPKLSGVLNVNAKKIRVNYLNTIYNFSQQIIITNNSFDFDNVVIYDIPYHNKAIVNGKVYHDNFKNFQLDFDIQTYKFMCLNTTEADNSLYYGTAFMSGIVNISGYMDNILIEAKLKTENAALNDKSDKINLISKTEITKLYIPLSSSGEISENSFITFVKKDSSITIKNDYKVQLGGLILNFDLDVTPEAEVQLIFDQRVGDIIKTRGNGNIKLNIDTKGDFKMYGDYVISSGDYLFTLKNIINKKFDIEKGSTIKWNGIPYKADLNLSAIYKARATLTPFLDSVSKKRYPIDVKLLMTGDLMSPDINFNIGLPTVDAGTRQKVLGYIDNDAEMNRQVFSLLILNSFVTPYQLNNSGDKLSNTSEKGSSAAGATTSELLSNQLSNMLRNISNDFDVGVNVRPGDEVSSAEAALALSTQLFNDKLSIDGNLGVNNNNQSANNIVGDVNIDYKLTDDGKLRVKAFNKSNDITNQVISTGPYTQGVGAFYREEFDTIGELFRRYLERIKNGKKKEATN